MKGLEQGCKSRISKIIIYFITKSVACIEKPCFPLPIQTFRQNYRTTFLPTVPTSAVGISHVIADMEAPGGVKWEHLKKRGKAMASYP